MLLGCRAHFVRSTVSAGLNWLNPLVNNFNFCPGYIHKQNLYKSVTGKTVFPKPTKKTKKETTSCCLSLVLSNLTCI